MGTSNRLEYSGGNVWYEFVLPFRQSIARRIARIDWRTCHFVYYRHFQWADSSIPKCGGTPRRRKSRRMKAKPELRKLSSEFSVSTVDHVFGGTNVVVGLSAERPDLQALAFDVCNRQ